MIESLSSLFSNDFTPSTLDYQLMTSAYISEDWSESQGCSRRASLVQIPMQTCINIQHFMVQATHGWKDN